MGALVGVGAGVGADAGAQAGAELVAERDAVFGEDAWDALADIPEDSAAALVLLDHRWAMPLRDAIVRARGVRLASEFVSPLDLVAVGLVAAEEAETLAGASADTI